MESSKVDMVPIRPAPFLPPPTDRLGTASRSRSGTITTVKGKEGVRGFMTDFLNSSERPEVITLHDPVHLPHADFNPTTVESTRAPNGVSRYRSNSSIGGRASPTPSFATSAYDVR